MYVSQFNDLSLIERVVDHLSVATARANPGETVMSKMASLFNSERSNNLPPAFPATGIVPGDLYDVWQLNDVLAAPFGWVPAALVQKTSDASRVLIIEPQPPPFANVRCRAN